MSNLSREFEEQLNASMNDDDDNGEEDDDEEEEEEEEDEEVKEPDEGTDMKVAIFATRPSH